MATRLLLLTLWLVRWLPLSWQALLGRGLGALLYKAVKSRRKVALRNIALTHPQWSREECETLAREHFGWLGRSLLERGLLWYGSRERLLKLIHVEGDVKLAERSERPVMWIVPHFVALDVAGVACQLHIEAKGGSIYQEQTNKVFDAAMRKARLRFGKTILFPRSESAKPIVRAIRQGYCFFNLPDMDFGLRDAAFVPFFGIPAATLLAPSRMARALDMVVQPIVAEILPGGQGYKVRFLDPLPDFPSDDPALDAARMNAWIEQEIERNPAQYLWVHRRFKTRPEGEASLY